MEITEIRVFPKEGQDKKLKGYATVTFDNAFVIRNIKVIHGASSLFIAMPSRKMKHSCPKCHFKNETGSKFCNHCGSSLGENFGKEESADVKSEHRDICHPITQEFREYIQKKILEAFENQSNQPQLSSYEGD